LEFLHLSQTTEGKTWGNEIYFKKKGKESGHSRRWGSLKNISEGKFESQDFTAGNNLRKSKRSKNRLEKRMSICISVDGGGPKQIRCTCIFLGFRVKRKLEKKGGT